MLRSLLEALAGFDAERAARQVRRAVIDFAFAGAAFLVGLGFLTAAGVIFASERFGAVYATLGFGVGFIVLAGLILVLHRTISTVKARRREREQRSEQMKSMVTAAAFAAVPALLRSGSPLAQILLPLAGIAAFAIFRENARSREEPEEPQGDREP